MISSCAPIQAQQACASSEEVAALEARILVTELMVAALTCKAHQKYNKFIRTHAQELEHMDGQLREMYSRMAEGAEDEDLGHLVTRIANEAAIRAARSRDDYCRQMAVVLDLSLQVAPGRLAALTVNQPFIRRHEVRSCQADATSEATRPVTR